MRKCEVNNCEHQEQNYMTTKDIIIEEARKVFVRYGFNKTSMADIALASRKGRRTLYTYFTSKEDVFKAVLEKEVKVLTDKLEPIITSNQSADIKLRTYLKVRMMALKDLTLYYSAMRHDFMNNLGLLENLRKDYDALEISLIQGMLEEGNAHGIFAIENTRFVSHAMLVAVKGFELPIFLGTEDPDYEELIDPMITLFFNGLIVKR